MSNDETTTDATGSARLEDFLAGRVLAWAGGLAVLLGIAFGLAIAISNGWIGAGTRSSKPIAAPAFRSPNAASTTSAPGRVGSSTSHATHCGSAITKTAAASQLQR